MTVNHDVVSSSLTGAANEKATQQGGFFHWLFLLVPADDIVVGSHMLHRLSVAKSVVDATLSICLPLVSLSHLENAYGILPSEN